jgi:hypothetical protein
VSNAAKPAVLKRSLGNPGKRALPDSAAVMVVQDGYRAGRRLRSGRPMTPTFLWPGGRHLKKPIIRLPETWEYANPGLVNINAVSDFESSVCRTP